MVTQLNLVTEQVRIAEGEKLSFKQEDIRWQGNAIECRIYAEDSFNNFMPTTGKISYLREPGGFGVRVDSGIESGSEISIHFDPMLSKLVVWGKNRERAIERMERALKYYRVKGVKTTIPFEIAVMRHPIYRSGDYNTGFIEKHLDVSILNEMKAEYEEVISAISAYGYQMLKQKKLPQPVITNGSAWKQVGRAKRLV